MLDTKATLFFSFLFLIFSFRFHLVSRFGTEAKSRSRVWRALDAVTIYHIWLTACIRTPDSANVEH